MSSVTYIEDFLGDYCLPFKMLCRVRANAFLALSPRFEEYAERAQRFIALLKDGKPETDTQSLKLNDLRADYYKAAAKLTKTCNNPSVSAREIIDSAYETFAAAEKYGSLLQFKLQKAITQDISENNLQNLCIYENYIRHAAGRFAHWRNVITEPPHGLWNIPGMNP